MSEPAATATSASQASYDDWHGRYDVDTRVDTPWHTLLQQRLHTEDLAGRRILEIACGRGGFACWLSTQPARPAVVVAADFSVTAVTKGLGFARASGIDRVTWNVADAQQLPFGDASMDTVISCETIEHLPSPRRALAEFARVLRPGGRLYLTAPNYFGPMGLYRGYLRVVGRPFTEEGQPINRFLMLPRTGAWVRTLGLKVERIESIGHYAPWPGRPPVRFPALDGVGPLKWFGLHSLIVARKAGAR